MSNKTKDAMLAFMQKFRDQHPGNSLQELESLFHRRMKEDQRFASEVCELVVDDVLSDEYDKQAGEGSSIANCLRKPS